MVAKTSCLNVTNTLLSGKGLTAFSRNKLHNFAVVKSKMKDCQAILLLTIHDKNLISNLGFAKARSLR